MAKAIKAYLDERGHVHSSPSDAIVADIAATLGRVGEEGGLTMGVAALILEKRGAIEKAFADHDRLLLQEPDEFDGELQVPPSAGSDDDDDDDNVHQLQAG